MLAGQGWGPYWKSPWNKFDFLLVCTSLFDIICSYALSASLAKVLGVQKLLRLLRISRMFKLVRGIAVGGWNGGGWGTCGQPAPSDPVGRNSSGAAPSVQGPDRHSSRLQGLRSLFSTLIISLPAFWNVGRPWPLPSA